MTAAAAPAGSDWTARRILILATVQIATLLFGMTTTIANVLLPQMRGALSATPDQIAWVVTFYIVATAVATPMTGWLAGRLGWRTLMVCSIVGFTLASVACGLATSLEALVLFRVIQGAMGAAIMPLGQGILQATFPKRLQALVLMLWGIGGVFGPVLGPIVGGAVAEAYDWRWAFIAPVPFGLIAAAGAFAVLKDERGQSGRLDWTGFIALSVAVAATQLVLDRGQRLDWFDSGEIVAEAAIAAVAFWIFIAHSLTARNPFLDLRILLDRNFTIGTLFAFAFGMLMFTPMVLFPPLLQELRGFPDSVIGQLIAARGLGNWASFFVVVPMTRRWPRFTVGLGFGAQALAGLGMAQIDINVTIWEVFWTNALQGFGVGLCYTSMTVIAFATLPPRKLMEGNSLFHLMRNFGSSVFISMAVALYVRSAAENYADLTQHVSPFNETFLYPLLTGRWSFDEQAGLASLSREVARQAQMIGYINAFYLFAISAAAVIPLLFFVRRPRPA